MEARALGRLLQTSKAERLDLIAPGLSALVEHVQTLRADVSLLLESKRHRSARILDNLVQEEAAKVLILLDLVRHGAADDTVVKQQVRHFYDHVARGIYATVSVGAPASFREQRERAEELRVSLYLDGPNDVEWIFRNEIESGREDCHVCRLRRDRRGHGLVVPCGWRVPHVGTGQRQ